MSAMLKCPCCGATADHLTFRNVEALGASGEVVTALVLSCPRCDLVLGASVNPSEYVAVLARHIHAAADGAKLGSPCLQRPVV